MSGCSPYPDDFTQRLYPQRAFGLHLQPTCDMALVRGLRLTWPFNKMVGVNSPAFKGSDPISTSTFSDRRHTSAGISLTNSLSRSPRFRPYSLTPSKNAYANKYRFLSGHNHSWRLLTSTAFLRIATVRVAD